MHDLALRLVVVRRWLARAIDTAARVPALETASGPAHAWERPAPPRKRPRVARAGRATRPRGRALRHTARVPGPRRRARTR